MGELTYKPQASANSAGLADWPELKYANGVGLTAHTKTIRLKLDETQWQQLYTFDGKAGRIRRILVEGQRIAANVQGEEVLQINFMEPLGFEMLHRVGTLNYQTNSSTPELLFSPEGFKSSLTWHLVINTALVDQLGDLASLNGKRVLLDTEKINRQPDIFYVSGLEPLSK